MKRIQMDAERSRVFRNMISAMAEFKSVFQRDVDKSFVAELYTAEKFGLKINSKENEPGFDAIDVTGKRYEIKYRKPTSILDINNFDFDYIVLVNLDDNYQLTGMWLATANQAKEISSWREGYRKYQATQTKFKRIAEKVV